MKIGRVRISGGALLALAAVYFFDSLEFALLVLIAALAHELGHFLACRALGLELEAFEVNLWGFNLRLGGVLPYRADVLAALAGPFASLLFAFLASLAGRYGGFQNGYILAGVSFLFFFLNLLPIYPLDGGRALYALLSCRFGPETADKVCTVLGCALILILLCAGAYVFIRTRINFSLLLAGGWLLAGYCQTARSGIQSMGKKAVGSVPWIGN